jgi:hypothetical protein
MARMVPFPMLPTESTAERRIYEGLLQQLDESYVVYHSVDWLLQGPRGPISGEADFVITHPEDGLLVLEVKGGHIEYQPERRTWVQSGKRGGHPLATDPFHQARGQMHALVDLLSAHPEWERWKPSYGYAVAFPDGIYEWAAHPGAPAEVVIDRRHLDELADRVRRIMAHHRRPSRRFGAEGMEAVAEALGLRVEIRAPLGLEFHEEDRTIVELTEEQSWVRAWIVRLKRAAIVGAAGTGKTVLATEIARRMAEGGNRTLLTCFNKRLSDHLRRATQGYPYLDVAHFHALAHRLVSEAGIDLPEDVDTGPHSEYFEDRLPELLMEAADRLELRYDVMVVDEAQDFHEHWWPALLTFHTDPDEGRLYVFADTAQNLYGGGLPDLFGETRYPLPHNLRNTRGVASFVSVFYEGDDAAKPRGPEGRPVEILGYDDDEDLDGLLRTVLLNLIEEEKVPPEDIVVLTPAGTAKSRLRSRGSVDGFKLSEDPGPGEILATSVHAFKGLERPVVILAEIGERHPEDLDRYLYVGGSRARSHLIVLATEPVARELRERISA